MMPTGKGIFSLLSDDGGSEGGDQLDSIELRQHRRRRRLWLIGIIATFLLVVIIAIAVGLSGKTTSDSSSTGKVADHNKEPAQIVQIQLAEMVELEGIRGHLENLERVARENGNTRVMGGPGYNASMEYVLSTLKAKATGLDVHIEDFSVNKNVMDPDSKPQFIIQSQSPPRVFGKNDFAVLSNTGFGNITGHLIPAAANGCNATTDYEDITDAVSAGLGPIVALVERGTCLFVEKMTNAREAGAQAVVIYNRVGGDVFQGTLGAEGQVQHYIPSIGISNTEGLALRKEFKGCAPFQCDAPLATVAVRGEFKVIVSHNIIADAQTGDPNSMIVVGAHLDSVEAGPGINDNGSGSAAVLEVAIHFMRVLRDRSKNQVRFAWWGGEESGLLGSKHHVQTLNQTRELARVALNLNFDMLASPNYITGVYNGSDGTAQEDAAVAGSTYIQLLFQRYFTSKGQPFELSGFNGRSDYGPFLEHGVPAGGLDTGAEVVKDMAQRKTFGGLCRAAFDPCYHQDCDDVDNIAFDELGLMAGEFPLCARACNRLASGVDVSPRERGSLGCAHATTLVLVLLVLVLVLVFHHRHNHHRACIHQHHYHY